eukprot:8663243-Alexandrium_andersonii.AAC.1
MRLTAARGTASAVSRRWPASVQNSADGQGSSQSARAVERLQAQGRAACSGKGRPAATEQSRRAA